MTAPLVSTLTESFATQDNAKWTYSAGASVVEDRLVLQLNSSRTGEIYSAIAYSLVGSSISATLTRSPNVAHTTAEAYLQLQPATANTNALGWTTLGSALQAYTIVGGTKTVQFTATYSATTHAWWRIREAAGTVFWDTSPDRTTWTQRASWTAGFAVSSLFVKIGGGFSTGVDPSAYTTAATATTTGGGVPALPWASHVGTATTLAEEQAFLTALDSYTSRVRTLTLGSSAQTRTIRAVVVGPARTRDEIRSANTALIIGSIHGDEWAGREALFEHMRNHATGSGTDTIVYIPTLNPDGFTLVQRNLANGSDPNRLWSQTGVDQQSSSGAYFPEQQCLRQAILLWRPKIIFDTHEYTSSGITFRFDPGTVNASGTPAGVITAAQDALTAMRTAATAAGYTIANYGGAIPDDGATQAFKRGGIPAIFTESPQESSAGLVGRRAQQLSAANAFSTFVQGNASTLATLAASATWWSGFSPTVVDS